MTYYRAFSLAEILVSIAIISLLFVGSVGMTNRYVRNLQWDQLFSRLEQQFWKINIASISQTTSSYLIPDQFHVYFELGDVQYWYIETRENVITYQRFFSEDELQVSSLKLLSLQIQEVTDRNFQTKEFQSVLMTFSNPFALISFQGYPHHLEKSNNLLVSNLVSTPQNKDCLSGSALCTFTLTYGQDGSEERKSLMIDSRKGVKRL